MFRRSVEEMSWNWILLALGSPASAGPCFCRALPEPRTRRSPGTSRAELKAVVQQNAMPGVPGSPSGRRSSGQAAQKAQRLGAWFWILTSSLESKHKSLRLFWVKLNTINCDVGFPLLSQIGLHLDTLQVWRYTLARVCFRPSPTLFLSRENGDTSI